MMVRIFDMLVGMIVAVVVFAPMAWIMGIIMDGPLYVGHGFGTAAITGAVWGLAIGIKTDRN